MGVFFGLPTLFIRYLIGRRGLTVEFISPTVAFVGVGGILFKPEEEKNIAF